jgi:DNA-binding NtrC family response regulator
LPQATSRATEQAKEAADAREATLRMRRAFSNDRAEAPRQPAGAVLRFVRIDLAQRACASSARPRCYHGRFEGMSSREPTDAPTRATTLVREDGSPRRRLLAFWKHGSATFELPESGAVTVGRGSECDVRIDHATVSRKHARFHLGRRVAVEDLGSSNGTVVGGRGIAKGEIAAVEPGVVVEVGSAMLLVQGGDADRAAAPVGGVTPPTGDDDPRPRRARATEPPPGPVSLHPRADVIVEDAAMERLYRLAELVGKSTISVILLGETGAGKEVLAETIHRKSARAKGPFVRLNCAALPDNLLESELFGYERGAFTGAVAPKPGLLEAAHGGTVFLDEVGELPLATQAKLLRVLESGEVSRLGSLKPRPIDVRFLAATNRDIDALVASGAFRQDLYYRLNGICIQVPPLRERKGEIRALARAFLRDACRRAERDEPEITAAAFAKLEAHPWPGNVRELRNVVQRAALLCQGDAIEPDHVMLGTSAGPPREAPPPPSSRSAAASAADDEKQRIIDALDRCGGNQKEAAKVLGISRRTLVYRLDAFGLPRPRKR